MPKFLDAPSWYASNGTQVYGVGTSNSTSHTNGAVPVWRQVGGYFDEIVPTLNGYPFTDVRSWYAPTTNPNGGRVLSSTGTGAPTWKETLSSVNGRAIQSSYGNTGIYAPVSSGTKGQVLVSGGNGVAPGWSDANPLYMHIFTCNRRETNTNPEYMRAVTFMFDHKSAGDATLSRFLYNNGYTSSSNTYPCFGGFKNMVSDNLNSLNIITGVYANSTAADDCVVVAMNSGSLMNSMGKCNFTLSHNTEIE